MESAMRDRLDALRDAMGASFGFASGIAMVAGLVLGFSLPEIDDAVGLSLVAIDFIGQDEARGLLETIATVTVFVAGLTFSVTVVAFTLASAQLSPRVLRSFRGDRLSQMTLALFLGIFMYCLAVLVRLGSTPSDAVPPNLSTTVALLAAFLAFVMFARFIGHILTMLQPSSVIDAIRSEMREETGHLYPGDSAGEPEDVSAATSRAEQQMAERPSRPLTATSEGYVDVVSIGAVISAAGDADVLVRQIATAGSFVLPGSRIADVFQASPSSEDQRQTLDQCVRDAFVLSTDRGITQDVSFPVRQLVDIALKGLSPGINDPTTAVNALDATAAGLIRFIEADHPSAVRVDAAGEPRFAAAVPALSDLVRLGFEQSRVFAAPYPVVSLKMIKLLAEIRRAADAAGFETSEIDRQERLLREAAGEEVNTSADAELVAAAEAAAVPTWD